MYGEIVTRLRYKPSQLEDKVFKVTGYIARLYNDPPEIPFPVLSDYEYCTASLESYEDNKDKIYDVQYELHYKWNNVLYKLDTTISENGTAEFTRLIKGLTYYITAIPLDGKYQSKQMKITLDEYDIRQEPVALTTYENTDYKNYDHHMILKNIFGDANVYLDGNPDYISLDRNDKNLRVYLNKDATERASEFDLIIEDYRIEDIIISRKTISVNDGFSSPYDISIEFTDSNAAIFRWKADGEYSINKFYISNSINDKKIPTDVIDTSTYIITNYDNSKTHYLWISSIRDGKEKISDPVTIGAFDKSINPLIGPSVNYSINQNNDLIVYLNHNSTNVDNYSVYLEENEITSIDGLKPIVTSASKNIVIPNFDVYNNYDRTLKLLATTNKYNHSYLSENKDLYVAYDWTPEEILSIRSWLISDNKDNILTNEKLSLIKDKSGNNANAVPYSNDLNNSAEIIKNELNNRDVWKCSPSGYKGIFNIYDKTISNNVGGITLCIVSKSTHSIGSNGTYLIRIDVGSNQTVRAMIGRGYYGNNIVYGGGRRLDNDNFFEIHENTDYGTDWIIAIYSIDYINSKAILSINGRVIEKDAPFNGGNSQATDTLNISIGHWGSGIGDTAGYGYYAESIIFESAINTDQRINLEGYLANQWGLTDNLPSDHPYKNQKPIIDHTPSFTYEILEDE